MPVTFAISLEELALHQCLMQIDGHHAGTADFEARLLAAGLAEQADGAIKLSAAGVELCRSLQHRLAADKEAERVVAQAETGNG